MRLARRLIGGARALRSLEPGQRAAFARAFGELLVCGARWRWPRLLRADALVRRETGKSPVAPAETAPPAVDLSRLRSAFRLAVKAQPFGVPCVPRALALRRYLRHHGASSELRVGLRPKADGLRGHAWVERGGVPFLSAGEGAGYVPLSRGDESGRIPPSGRPFE